MKTETLILLGIGAYLLYAYAQKQKQYTNYEAPVLPAAQPTPKVPAPQQIFTAAQLYLLNQIKQHEQTSGTAAQSGGAGGVAGVWGVCDTSNKLTTWGTNANYTAVTLQY